MHRLSPFQSFISEDPLGVPADFLSSLLAHASSSHSIPSLLRAVHAAGHLDVVKVDTQDNFEDGMVEEALPADNLIETGVPANLL